MEHLIGYLNSANPHAEILFAIDSIQKGVGCVANITLYLVAWNSQGARWNHVYPILWNAAVHQIIPPALAENNFFNNPIVAVITEAGRAPWIGPNTHQILINKVYPMDDTYYKTLTDAQKQQQAFINTSLEKLVRTRTGSPYWIPWVKEPGDPPFTNKATDPYDPQQNPRCSLGGFINKVKISYEMRALKELMGRVTSKRPIVRIPVEIQTNEGQAVITIFQVHLTSGGGKQTKTELKGLISSVAQIVGQSTPAIIVGDININILGGEPELPEKHWTPLRTGKATQLKGGELDYALLYDPNGQIEGAAGVVQPYYDGSGDKLPNQSDHSMMLYTLTFNR